MDNEELIKAINELLGHMDARVSLQEVEAGYRVYVSDQVYGTSRFHVVSKKSDGIQIDQINIDEQWSKRINIPSGSLPAFLSIFLMWYLKTVEMPAELGDLDDHPF